MRKVGHVLLVVTIAAIGVTLTGCPEKDNLVGSWIIQFSNTDEGITVATSEIYKFFDNGKAARVTGYAFSGSGWSAEVRMWMIGTYTANDAIVTISFSGTPCQDVAAKLIVTGAVPEDIALDLDDMFAEMADNLSSLPLDTLPLPYSVDGDTLILAGFIAYSRFDDNFDYGNPNSNSCAQ